MRDLPVLYSFRRCPYAMRARLALQAADVKVALREVLLKDKPAELLQCSAKGTVPVLDLQTTVIDESLDIACWALNQQNSGQHWRNLSADQQALTLSLITENDGNFKQALDRYKYADRYPEHSQQYYRQQGELFLKKLDQSLHNQPHLLGKQQTLTDIAIVPFIRQFALVDWDWFSQSQYKSLVNWLEAFLSSRQFQQIMQKYSPWQPTDSLVLFPEDTQR